MTSGRGPGEARVVREGLASRWSTSKLALRGTAVNTENARMFKGLHSQSSFRAGPLAAASLLHPALGGR